MGNSRGPERNGAVRKVAFKLFFSLFFQQRFSQGGEKKKIVLKIPKKIEYSH